jgi:hypothetical protein
VIEHRNPSAYEFRVSAQQAADLALVHNSDEPMPIIDSIGHPTMLFGDVAEVNAAMVINHSVIVALIGSVTGIGSVLDLPVGRSRRFWPAPVPRRFTSRRPGVVVRDVPMPESESGWGIIIEINSVRVH